MEKTLNYILGVLVLVLGGYILFAPTPESTDIKYIRQVDSLNNIIVNLQQEQEEASKTITIYEENVKRLDLEIQETKEKITKMQKDYEAKIKNINKLTPSQLSKFFTERYK